MPKRASAVGPEIDEAPASASRPKERRRLLVAALVGLTIAVAWSPALRNGFCSDDIFLIVENQVLSQPGAFGKAFTQDFWSAPTTGWQRDYYRPLANVSYVVDSWLYGKNAAGFHATNVIAHGLVAALLVLFLLDVGVALPAAAAGAVLFGLHPALAEVVAWVSGRTDLLAALWVLVFLLLDRRRERPASRALSLGALALALLTKEVAVVAPLFAIGADLCRGVRPWPALRRRWDLGLVVVAFLVLRAQVLGAVVTHGQPAIQGIDFAARVAALPHLLGVLAAPWLGRIDYGMGLPAAVLIPAAAVGVALAAGLAFAAWRAQRRRPAGVLDPLAFLVLAAAASFAPLVAAVLVKATISQRLLYVPALFVAPACAALVLHRPRKERWAVLGIVALAFAATSLAKIPHWSSTRALWEAAVRESHPSALAHCNLAKGQHDEGRLGAALQELDVGLDERATSVGHQLRAVIYTEIGCYDLALADYRRALDLSPGDLRTLNNYAATLAELGRFDEGYEFFTGLTARGFGGSLVRQRLDYFALRRQERSGAPDPPAPAELTCGEAAVARQRAGDLRFLAQRGAARLKAGVLNQAEILFEASAALDGGFIPAQLGLARCRALNGDAEQARALLRGVLARSPGNVTAQKMLDQLDRRPPPRGEPGEGPPGPSGREGR